MSRDIWILRKNTLPAEVVVLMFAGLVMMLLGILLFPVYAGYLPYYEDGVFSLLIIVYALQILALGKSPFGDVRRNLPTVLFGVVIAVFGIVICFIPDIAGDIPRLLLILFLCIGGVIQLAQLYRDREADKIRKTADPLLGKLTISRAAVYLLSVVLGGILVFQSMAASLLVCVVVLGYGAALTILAWIIRKVYRKYPPKDAEGSVNLSVGNVMLLLIGIFMVVLGVMLIPVNLGLLPFSPSSQLGLLLVIFSMQMMLLGETPIGAFPRSHLVVGIGYFLGVIGVICCIIPNVLLILATVLIAVVNICGGVIGLGRIVMTIKAAKAANEPALPIFIQMLILQIVMNVLTILFGTSMLVATLIPGLLLGVILAANGCALLALLYLIRKAERLQAAAA